MREAKKHTALHIFRKTEKKLSKPTNFEEKDYSPKDKKGRMYIKSNLQS